VLQQSVGRQAKARFAFQRGRRLLSFTVRRQIGGNMHNCHRLGFLVFVLLFGFSCNSQTAPESKEKTAGDEKASAPQDDSKKAPENDAKGPLPAKNTQETPDSVVLSRKFENVENGSAYDKAAVELGDFAKVILPDDATVRQEGEGKKLQIYMKKTLGFAGHPPEPMSIKHARNHMGCAVQLEKTALVIATFGEWDSHIEGGARMKVLFVVPKGVEIEKRSKLSGENSICSRAWEGGYLTKPVEVKEGYWYGPASPAEGWKAVKAVPDLERPLVSVEIGATEDSLVKALKRRGIVFRKSGGEGLTMYTYGDGLFGSYIYFVQDGRVTRMISQ
jgi:hypothetical protein